MPVENLGVMTAERYYAVVLGGRVRTLQDYAQQVLGKIAARKGVRLPPTSEVADVLPLTAFVYRDQWVAGCPDCARSLQLAWESEAARLFMCTHCWNADVGGCWRPVAFPAERAAIEAALNARPHQDQRNWLPSERVEDLAEDTLRVRNVRAFREHVRGGRV